MPVKSPVAAARGTRFLTCAGAAGILGRMGDSGPNRDDWTIDQYLDRLVFEGEMAELYDDSIDVRTMDAESRKEP